MVVVYAELNHPAQDLQTAQSMSRILKHVFG